MFGDRLCAHLVSENKLSFQSTCINEVCSGLMTRTDGTVCHSSSPECMSGTRISCKAPMKPQTVINNWTSLSCASACSRIPGCLSSSCGRSGHCDNLRLLDDSICSSHDPGCIANVSVPVPCLLSGGLLSTKQARVCDAASAPTVTIAGKGGHCQSICSSISCPMSFCQSWQSVPTCFGLFRGSSYCFIHPDGPRYGKYGDCEGKEAVPVRCFEKTRVITFSPEYPAEGLPIDIKGISQGTHGADGRILMSGDDLSSVSRWLASAEVSLTLSFKSSDFLRLFPAKFWSIMLVLSKNSLSLEFDGRLDDTEKKRLGLPELAEVAGASLNAFAESLTEFIQQTQTTVKSQKSEIRNVQNFWVERLGTVEPEFLVQTRTISIDGLVLRGVDEVVELHRLNETLGLVRDSMDSAISRKLTIVFDASNAQNRSCILDSFLFNADQVRVKVYGNDVKSIKSEISNFFQQICTACLDGWFRNKISFEIETDCRLRSGCRNRSFCGKIGVKFYEVLEVIRDIKEWLRSKDAPLAFRGEGLMEDLLVKDEGLMSVSSLEWLSCFDGGRKEGCELFQNYNRLCFEGGD